MSIYYPFCREKDCNGLLKIKFNDDLTLDYECEKNKDHKGKKIYFTTFERFYLKEEVINKCTKCNLYLLNNNIFKCKECNKLFCFSCHLLEEHIKKNNDKLEIIKGKCSIHDMDLNQYCIECKKNLCIYFIRQDEPKNVHKNHNIKNIVDYIPSLTDINNLKNKIKQKTQIYTDLIKKLDKWKLTINKKIEVLKNSLNEEINILEKMIFSFNHNYMNYTYFSNFFHTNEFIKDINNEYLIKFYQEDKSFRKQSENLIEFFSLINPKELKPKYVKGEIKEYIKDIRGYIEKINNKYFVGFINRQIFNYYYDKEDDKIYYSFNKDIAIYEEICSISISLDEKQL